MSLWEKFLDGAIEIALLIVLVLILRLALRRWLTPGWCCALWMLVLLRLFLPAVPAYRYSLQSLLAQVRSVRDVTEFVEEGSRIVNGPSPVVVEARVSVTDLPEPPFSVGMPYYLTHVKEGHVPQVAGESMADEPLQGGGDASRLSPDSIVTTESAQPERYELSEARISPVKAQTISALHDAYEASFGLWLRGLVVVFGLFMIRLDRLRRLRKRLQPADSRLEAILSEARAMANVQRPVNLKLTDDLNSPALIGLWKPVILVPSTLAQNLTTEELNAVFLHELAHLRRNDLALDALMTLAVALHWFNPFVWLARYWMGHDREAACDEMAVRWLGRRQSKAYGETLLKVAQGFSGNGCVAPALGMARSKSMLERRLARVLAPEGRRVTGVLVGAVAFLGAALVGATGRYEPGPERVEALFPSQKRTDQAVTVQAALVQIKDSMGWRDCFEIEEIDQLLTTGAAKSLSSIEVSAPLGKWSRNEVGQLLQERHYNYPKSADGFEVEVRRGKAEIIGSLIEVHPTFQNSDQLQLDLHFEHHLESPKYVALAGDSFTSRDGAIRPEVPDLEKLSLSAAAQVKNGEVSVVATHHGDGNYKLLLVKAQWNQ